jgi:hypothetical protein
MVKPIALLLFCQQAFAVGAQDTGYLKVHFLYGSKPLPKYKKSEQRWFGGVLGGHVGIESDSNRIVNFLPSGKFHVLARRNKRHSRFAVHSAEDFYAILGGEPDSARKLIVHIPVTRAQQHHFDSVTASYLGNTPYDYAFWGMRCGAAAYELLARLELLQPYSQRKTFRKIFYPRRLRKRLLKAAAANSWTVVRQEGSRKRKWERD